MSKKNKIQVFINFIQKSVIFITLLFSLTSVIITIKGVFLSQINFNYSHLTIITLLVSLVFYTIYKILNNLKKKNTILYIIYPLIIFLIALTFRLLSNFIFGLNFGQVSDFKYAFENGISRNYYQHDYYARFSQWALYPQLIYLISKVFNNQYVITHQIFNTIISSLSCVAMYFIGKNISKKTKIGLTSGLLFAFYLPNIIYVNILTPEHPTILFLLIGFLFYLLGNSKKNIKTKSIFYIISTFILTISYFFRPFAQILIVSILIYEIVKYIYLESNKCKLIPISIIFISYIIFNNLGYKYIEFSIGKSINKSFVYSLYAGLNSKCQGFYCAEIAKEINYNFDQNDQNYKVINKIILSKLTNDLKNNYYLLPNTFKKKFVQSWSGDNSSISLLMYGDLGKSTNINNILWNYILPLSSLNYLIINILIFLNLIYLLSQKNKINYFLFLINIFLIGIFLLFLLFESQSRYKSVIIPFLIILSTYKNTLKK